MRFNHTLVEDIPNNKYMLIYPKQAPGGDPDLYLKFQKRADEIWKSATGTIINEKMRRRLLNEEPEEKKKKKKKKKKPKQQEPDAGVSDAQKQAEAEQELEGEAEVENVTSTANLAELAPEKLVN